MKKKFFKLQYPLSFDISLYSITFLISSFIFSQIINRIFPSIPLTVIFYPILLGIFFLLNFHNFTVDSKVSLLLVFLYLFIYSYGFSSIKVLFSILTSILTFYFFYRFKESITKCDLKVSFLILRIFIYSSFLIFILTYSGITEIGIDTDNIIYGLDGYPGLVRERCVNSDCFNVFRSFFTNSNYFAGFLFFIVIYSSKLKEEIINFSKISINGFKFNSLYFDFFLIGIMASFSESRIYFIGIFVVLLFQIFKILKSKLNFKSFFFLFSSLIVFWIFYKDSLNLSVPLTNALIYLPKTILERIPDFLNFKIPFTFFGNGFGTNWLGRYFYESEYLIQTIIIDFGILGIILCIIPLQKIIFDIVLFLKEVNISLDNKFINITAWLIFSIMLLKASSDINNIPLAMSMGFCYPNKFKLKR